MGYRDTRKGAFTGSALPMGNASSPCWADRHVLGAGCHLLTVATVPLMIRFKFVFKISKTFPCMMTKFPFLKSEGTSLIVLEALKDIWMNSKLWLEMKW